MKNESYDEVIRTETEMVAILLGLMKQGRDGQGRGR